METPASPRLGRSLAVVAMRGADTWSVRAMANDSNGLGDNELCYSVIPSESQGGARSMVVMGGQPRKTEVTENQWHC